MTRLSAILFLAACTKPGAAEVPATETDTDSDSDTDTDTDTDTDADTAVTPETGDTAAPDPALLFDAAHVLVVPTNDGVALFANDTSLVYSWRWNDMVGDCSNCTGEGANHDGDGLLFSWAGFGQNQGVVRIANDASVEFVIRGMAFPHDAIRDPADQTILVPEAFDSSVRWYAGDGSSEEPIRDLNDADAGWTQTLTNGTELVPYNGRNYLLVSNRGAGAPVFGRITFWDITDVATPTLVWSYPPSGSLDTPHGPVFRYHLGQWLLLYAHSYGGPDNGGTVGVAVTADPTILPSYAADLVPAAPVGPFDFLRGVELTEDGILWMTDSGSEFGGANQGRIASATLPVVVPDGSAGSVSAGDQDFVELTDAALFMDGLDNPFEGWLWLPTIVFPP